MSGVLFEPHHDDAALFAAYTVMSAKPAVVTVMGNAQAQLRYGITQGMRVSEQQEAMQILGVPEWIPWSHNDLNPDLDAVCSDMERLDSDRHPSFAWAPLYEPLGHEHHNLVAIAARQVFGERARFYATYQRGSGRSRTQNEVTPEPSDPSRKLRAMACYESQINLGNTQPWFAADDALREWVA